MTDTNQLPPLPPIQPGDSHMESLIEADIQQAEAKTDEMGPLFVKGALSGIVDAQVRDLWPTKSATHPAAVPMTCHCQTCRPITITDMRMVLCPKCGNKRCPHANDHRNACTGSNEPGQPGSAYPDHHGITAQAKKEGE